MDGQLGDKGFLQLLGREQVAKKGACENRLYEPFYLSFIARMKFLAMRLANQPGLGFDLELL